MSFKSFHNLFRRKSREKDITGNVNKDENGNKDASDQLIHKEAKQYSMVGKFTKHSVSPADLNEPIVQKYFAENENYKVIKTITPVRVVTETKIKFDSDPLKKSRTPVMSKVSDILNNNKKNHQYILHNSAGTISNKIFMVRTMFYRRIKKHFCLYANKHLRAYTCTMY